jgi:hypothetical protein
MAQQIKTPPIASCARCGAKAMCIDWNFDGKHRVWCDNNHVSTKECGSRHRAICLWNNAQIKLQPSTSAHSKMTDPTPNDLPVSTPLSPDAQFVLDAVFDQWPGGYNHPGKPRCVAAALRAASARMMRLGYDSVNSKYLEGIEASSDLLDQIATELENQP